MILPLALAALTVMLVLTLAGLVPGILIPRRPTEAEQPADSSLAVAPQP